MSRHETLERILDARYDYDYAPRESKAYFQKVLYDLVDKSIAGTEMSRYDLLEAIHDRYLEFKRERRMKEKVMISQRLQ